MPRRETNKAAVKDMESPLSREEIQSFAVDQRQSKEEKDLGDLVGL